MDYASLTGTKGATGSIRTWINKDVPADEILTDAQAYIFRRLRVREMLTSTTGTLTASATSLALPPRYLATARLRVTTPATFDLDRVTVEEIDDMRVYDSTGAVQTGQPDRFGVAGTSAEFAVAADQQYTLAWRFWQEPAALSTATTTNWLTDKAPRLIRAVCLAFANEYMKDDAEKNHWLEVADVEMRQLMIEDDFEKRGIIVDRGGI